MLLWFTLGNYRSFKDKATLSLQATSSDELEDTNVYHSDGLRILKTAAIYGPNGGGKSNFLRGLCFMAKFVKESSLNTQIGTPINVEPFLLSQDTENEPSYFEAAFKTDKATYQYGFEADSKEVKKEWLYQTGTGKPARLFYREGMEIQSGRKFGAGKQIEKMVRNNSLFLSVASQLNVEVSKDILEWFGKIMDFTEIPHHAYQNFSASLYDRSVIGEGLKEDLKTLGFIFEQLSVEIIPPDSPLPIEGMRETLLEIGKGKLYKLILHHAKRDNKGKIIGTTGFDFSKMESMGTQKVVAFLPFIHLLTKSFLLNVADEFEANMHPLLARALLMLINQSTVTNGGQLIFATHDTNLLAPGLLRRDQVWLTPKNQREESYLVSLVEYKVKKENNMEKGYLEGRYGAIPYIGKMETKVITPSNAKKTRNTAKKKS
jgi:AAA15 family ATPase/GTPase